MSEGNREVLPDPGGQVANADAPNPDAQNVSKRPHFSSPKFNKKLILRPLD